jgi:hypothetical protein
MSFRSTVRAVFEFVLSALNLTPTRLSDSRDLNRHIREGEDEPRHRASS